MRKLLSEKRFLKVSIFISLFIAMPLLSVKAMHIMEGFLPPVWCISWGVICIPFVVKGYFSLKAKAFNICNR